MNTGVVDYLTKQITVDKNVVTFRSLSRHFNIHANIAKNELLAFHASLRSSEEPVYATYQLNGDVSPSLKPELNESNTDGAHMDVDQELTEAEIDEGEIVPETRVTLVGERDLETAKSAYIRIHSEYIYSLSPSPMVDAGLICVPTEQVYIADEKIALEASVLLGRITGPHVRTGKYVNATASSSKGKEPAVRTSMAAMPRKDKDDAKPKIVDDQKEPSVVDVKQEEQSAVPVKSKPTGMLDWSKAKAKSGELKAKEMSKKKEVVKNEVGEKESKRVNTPPNEDKNKNNGSSSFFDSKSKKSGKPDEPSVPAKEPSTSGSEMTRGKKRKVALPTDTDSEEAETAHEKAATPPIKNKPQTGVRLNGRRNVVISDDDGDDDDDDIVTTPVKAKGKTKAKPTVPKIEPETRSLRAMMDIDDDEVIKASDKWERQTEEPSEPGEEPEETATEASEDVEMGDDSDDEPVKPKPRKRKVKKVWPVGKNGFKKRRVVKSRMTLDDKGYMVTEDYSEYESVDEEEPEVEPPPKRKPAVKARKSNTPTEDRKPLKASDTTLKSKSTSGPEKPKRSGSSAGSKAGQGSLNSFFKKK